MNFSLLSTAALEKIAGSTWPGSPEYKAMQKELERRRQHYSDKATPSLFIGTELLHENELLP